MALSSCVKCGNGMFEVATATPAGSTDKVRFVQCSKCGGVIGLMDYHSLGGLLLAQNVAINAIAAKVGASCRPLVV
jgi:hypothetical protein